MLRVCVESTKCSFPGPQLERPPETSQPTSSSIVFYIIDMPSSQAAVGLSPSKHMAQLIPAFLCYLSIPCYPSQDNPKAVLILAGSRKKEEKSFLIK